MRILIIADYLPYPLVGGDRIRIYSLLRRAAARHEVSVAAFLEEPGDEVGTAHLRRFCAQVETAVIRRRSRLSRVPELIRFASAGKPPELLLLRSDELENKVRRLASATDFDIVQIEPSRMGLYLEALPRTRRPGSILMFQNISFQQYRRVSRIERGWEMKSRAMIHGLAMRRWEPRYAARFDRCTTVSEGDRRSLVEANPRLKVDVIPNGVDVQALRPLAANGASPSLLFIGNMGYPPCVDAALFFCREILPLVRRKVGGAEFWIVGRDPRPEVLRLEGDGVHVTGRVDDVLPYYRRCGVCVVPLRAGGGTRLKILESMALGRPVVSTTIGCEGLEVTDGEHLLVADGPERFAERTIRLLTDADLARRISEKARQLVEIRYDWDAIALRMERIYSEISAEKER